MTNDLLPHSTDLERAILSGIITAPEIKGEIAGIVSFDDFSDAKHRTLFRAIMAINGTHDLLTLVNLFEQKGKKYQDAIGGESYLLDLGADPPSYLLIPQYAREVAELAQQRRLLEASAKIAKLAGDGPVTPEVLAEAQQLLDGIAKRQAKRSTFKPLGADEILTTVWPEPVWAIPGKLPVGLTILAGKSKVGKSWLVLQICQSVAAGGVALGERVERGPVLYLALEDPYRRLQDRMKKQNWPTGLAADFMVLHDFQEQIGDLRNGGGDQLARYIEAKKYRMVAIDTLSRSIYGDQNDVGEMTAALSPIQDMAHLQNCAVVLLDHHHKLAGADALADILGSTAKGAVSDTAWGLYRERGKAGAKLAIIGRDVAEQELALTFDGLTGCWQCEGDAHTVAMTERRQEILETLCELRRCQSGELAEAIGQDRSNTYKRLQDLVGGGLVHRESDNGEIYYFLTDLGHELLQP